MERHGAVPRLGDADIRLTPSGEDVTLLAVSAVCRPALGSLAAGLDQMIKRRIAQESGLSPTTSGRRHAPGHPKPETQ